MHKQISIIKRSNIVAVFLECCSTMKLIEPLAQIKKIDSYSYRTVKTEPDLINACIDYMTYAIGAIIIVPIVCTGICEYFAVHD
jgi:hypothetical protein